MNNSHRRKVVLTENGELHNPINVDIVSVVVKCLCCSIGISLNRSITFSIIRLRRLRCKPRNLFLLGITLSYLSFFIPPAIELIYWATYPVESLCHAYVAVAVAPQGLLVVNMLLALIDRYLAINHPVLYRRKMTTPFAGCLIITCSMLTVFLMKFVYVVQLATIRCEILLVHAKLNIIILIILFTSCFVLNIIIYRQTKTLLRETRILQAEREESFVSSDNVYANNQCAVVTPMRIHIDRGNLSDVEMEATRTLVIGVASFCVMPCLALVFLATYFACRLVIGQLACNHLTGVGPFIKDLSLTPAVTDLSYFL